MNLRTHKIVANASERPFFLKREDDVKSFSLNTATTLIIFFDALIFIATGATIQWFHLGWIGQSIWIYPTATMILSVIVIVALNKAGCYELEAIHTPEKHFQKILGIFSVSFLSFLALAFAFKLSEQFSRIWFFSWFLSSFTLLTLGRIIFKYIFERWAKSGKVIRNLLIVGSGKQARLLLEKLKKEKSPWLKVLGIFDDRKTRISPSLIEIPVLGTLDDLLNYARVNQVDDILIALPWSADTRIFQIIKKIGELPVSIHLSSDLAGFSSPKPIFRLIGGLPMLNMVCKPLDGWKNFAKNAEDKIFGFALLLLFSPLMILIALAIRIESKGPILFRQNRDGFNNKPFSVFKFRTMYHTELSDVEMVQATRNDPRITPLGKILRRTSLDELPQLLNVLSGEMSLVGPRPHPVELNGKFGKIIHGYFSRHRVKPGITGWAQINGLRGETDTTEKMKARVAFDVHYIENWSFFLDLKILFLSAFVFIFQKNAY